MIDVRLAEISLAGDLSLERGDEDMMPTPFRRAPAREPKPALYAVTPVTEVYRDEEFRITQRPGYPPVIDAKLGSVWAPVEKLPKIYALKLLARMIHVHANATTQRRQGSND